MEPTKEKVVPKRKKKFLGCSQLDHFELGQKVGVGTFGEVVKAKHVSNGKVVALKKIFTKSEQEGFPITSLREIKLLKNVTHTNVASLIDMAVSYKTDGEFKEIEDVYMVFPFMDHDLTGILENQSINLTLPQIKCYMKQLLEGISYLHSRQIMHRDLKGANLLVNNRGELKITDFGLARPIEENRIKYTPGVVTRWYRPPELLFGSDIYDESIDIWGTGCIIAEMYLRKPLFGASSDLDQLRMVCLFCGTPTEETYPGVSQLPDFSKVQLKDEKRIIKDFLRSKNIDETAVDLINRMLIMDPKKRITAKGALEHEYFTTAPLPCLPSEIEKFESSHVYTVQQQREKEIAENNKRSRPEDHDHEYEHHRHRHPKRNYVDYDARAAGEHGNSNHLKVSERLRYNDGKSTPPPPPPPPPPTTERDRRDGTGSERGHTSIERSHPGSERDHRERDQRDKDHRERDHGASMDSRTERDRRPRDEHDYEYRRSRHTHGDYYEREYGHGHSSHSYGHSHHSHTHSHGHHSHSHSHSQSHPHSSNQPSPIHPTSTERRVYSSRPATPELETKRLVTEVPPPPSSTKPPVDRSRQAISYDDL